IAKETAREKLKQADKAVNDLWEVIESKYKEDTGDELGDPDERTPQASNAYMNWYTKCQTDYKSCFKETDEALIKAQTKYYSSNDANTRAQAQLLYQQADLLEESILVNYSEIAKHGALEAARKRITQEEVENAYKLIQNEHAQKISEITINGKMPSETWADDTERTSKRTSAVTTATQKAIEAFQAEEERLAYIKKRWIASIKEEKRDSKLKRERAAKSYAEGDVSSWYELTAEEREAYNKAVIKADEVYENVAPEKVRTAQSNLREANRQLGKINSSRMNWNYQKQKQTALTEIKKAEEKLTKVQKEQKEHAEEIEKAIRWAKLTYEDREAEIAEKQAQTAREKLQIAKKTAKQTAKNSKEPLSWIYVAFCFDGASSSWKHASEELTKGNQKIATLWIKVAEQKKSLAEQHKQAAYAYASDNTEALMRWDEANNKDGPLWSATHCLSDAISSLEKAAKANEEGKEELAKLYTQKAGCIQAAAEAYQKSAHAVVQGNEEEAERLKESANYNDSGKACLSKAIPSLEKATKMNVERKEEFAKLYNQQVKCYQAAAEAYQKIAQAVVQGNKEEAYFLRRAVRLFESDSTLSPGSVYCLSKAVSSLEEATKANAEGKIDIAKLYNQQVGCYQAEAEVHQKTAHALLQGNKEEAERLENSIGFLQLDSAFVSIILECLKRASEKNSSGNLELAQLWTKEIEKIKELAKHMSEIAQTHVQTNGIGNIQDIYGDRAIAALGRNAERLFEAAEYLIKATEAKNVGNPEIAELWDKNALAMKALAEHAREAIQAYMSGNTEATEGWDKAASLFWNSGDMSHETDAWIPKIAEAKEQGNLEVAELWKKGVEQIQALAEQWRQVAYDHALVNKKVTKQWDKIVLSAKEEDDYIGNKLFSKAHGWIAKINEWMPKIVEAKEQGNLEVASLWTKGVEQMLASAKEYQKALQVLVQGDEEEVENLKEEVELLDGDHSKKSTKVNEEWKSEIAKLHIQQAECYHTLAEEYSHVINVITQGEKEESQRLKEALKFLENDFYKDPRNYLACFSRLSSVYCLSEAASSLEKAIKANEEGKSKVAKLYTQQVKCYQAAAETSQKAAHAVVEWNEEEAERLGKVARIFGSCDARSPGSSYYLSKAISSSEKGDTAQMEGNSEIASLYTQQVDCYHALAEEIKKFAHAAVEGAEEEEAQCLEKQVDFFKSNARLLSKSSEYLVKSSEANNFGNLELAQLWAKEAKKIKELAKYMSEIVQAHVKIDELENIRDHRVGATLENHEYRLSNAAEYLTKAVEAKTSENPEIAELWDKNALAMKSLAEHAQEAIQAYMSGNTEAVEGWDKAASFFNKSVDNSHRAGAWIPKIAEAKAQGNLEVAALWTKIVEQLQSFAEQYRQAACAHASNNKKEAEQWDEIFADEDVYNKFLSNINEWTAKETEAKEQGYLETAALWAKAVEQMLVSFEQQIKQINTITKDTEESDKKIFLMITYSISSQAAECLANEAKAEAQGDQEIASLWSTASKQIQAFAEPHRQAVYAYASNNKKEAEQWDEIFADEDVYNKVFSEVKEWIRKIEEAKTQGHLEIAELWTKAVGQKMTSLKEYQKALQTLVQGNKEGAKRLMEERKLFDGNYESPGSSYCLSEAASCLEQAVKAQVEGKE
ncbi:MAG TPA: hypothetical protein VJK54_04810, partial [Chthoniobacterales bacterium]|nr:hypothetical protein [Chthoniobacterales bacterium]